MTEVRRRAARTSDVAVVWPLRLRCWALVAILVASLTREYHPLSRTCRRLLDTNGAGCPVAFTPPPHTRMIRSVSTLVFAACSLMAEGPEARDPVGNARQSRDYSARFREVEHKVQPCGSRRTIQRRSLRDAILYGRPFTRLIAREGPSEADRRRDS